MKRYSILLAAVLLLVAISVTTIPAEAAFPGANGHIVFASDRLTYNQHRIWRMDPDGANQIQLTFGTYDGAPAWSPDGTRIAFVTTRDGGREIYVMNADGTGQTRLTNDPAPDINTNPQWSPDGTRIVFNSNRQDANNEIYIMNADGTGLTRLTYNSADDAGPSWSPDGNLIAFNSNRDIDSEVYVMNADGSNQTNLTNESSCNDGAPDWSPDGTRIAFTSDCDGDAEIYVMKADGSEVPTQLTFNNYPDSDPAWSPDGTRIAFHSWPGYYADIYVINADGSEPPTQLTQAPEAAYHDYSPSWQPIPQDVNFEIRETISIPHWDPNSPPNLLHVGDLDDDGNLDIAYIFKGVSYIIERDESDEDTFVPRYNDPSHWRNFAKLDGDNYPDILATYGTGPYNAKIFEATGDNTYTVRMTMDPPGGKIEWPTRVGDSDGDGIGEFLIGTEGSGVYPYEATGNDTYAQEGHLTGSGTNVRIAGVYDLDADLFPETVITRYYPQNQTCVFKGEGDGLRTPMFCNTATFLARSLGDLDGDGLGEVIGDNLHYDGGWITEYLLILGLNETNDGFVEVYRAPLDPNPSYRYQAEDVIDFDEDGQSELWRPLDFSCSGYPNAFALAHLEKNAINTITHFYNSGTLLGSFTGEVRGLLAIGDTNGDGRFELAVVQGDQIHILEQIGLTDTDGDGISDEQDNCPTDSNQDQSNVDDDNFGDVCDVCPADPLDVCNEEGSAAEEIPADDGGTIETPDEALTIVIEPDDLSEDTTISVTQTVPQDPEVDLLIGPNPGLGQAIAVYDLEPDGLVLNNPVTVSITADVTELNQNQRDRLKLYLYTDTDGDEIEDTFVPLESVTCVIDEDPPGTFIKTCDVELDHFSTIAAVAPVDSDNDGIPDLFGEEIDYCPSMAAQELASIEYTGDLLIAIDETGSAPATLSALLTDEYSQSLAEVPISFSVTDSGNNVDGDCSATTDVSGAATCDTGYLVPDIYTILLESKIGCPAASTEALLVVYDPNVPRATGGGFILPDEESTLPAQSSKDKANFGFIVKLDKNQAAAGNLEFQYKTAGINLKSQSMTWYTISNNKAMFQGTSTINGEGLYTFRVHATDGDLTGDQPDAFDIKIWTGTDTEADPIHRAKNNLAGGSIVIHKK